MSFDFIKNEHAILKLWHDKDVFSVMSQKNKDAKATYNTLDGPITANNAMCVHHCWGRTLKDALIKYNTLKGRRTHFQNGFDAQGMWVEVEVEKDLGLGGKSEIVKYGLDKFTEKCIDRVAHYSKVQTDQSIRLGQVMDWGNSYYTNSDRNIEYIWNFLKVCHERKMLVKNYKAMPWCPRCGTSLSEHEMNGSYKDITHKAVFIKASVTDPKWENTKIIVWTTTPWTLSANIAIAVHPDNDYVTVEVGGENLIIGKSAIKVLEYKGAPRYKIVKEFKGKELDGLKYQPFLPLKVQEFEHKIVLWDEVSATDGSGAVHIAPGCGAEDFALGQKIGLKQIIPVDDAGVYGAEFEWLAGKNTTNCEDIIFDKLKANGTLLYTHDHAHSYPFCWRCKTNVIFRLVEGWDITPDAVVKGKTVRQSLLESVKGVVWEPPFIQKTMEDWLSNMGDWNISRRRFYGLPLPIYQCDCGHDVTVIGSRAELKKLAVKPDIVDKLPHLHRPYIDTVEIKCPHCGKAVKRIPDVGDCWLDAGIAPFSTAAKDYFPTSVVIEMKEQIRLWFYSQLFMSVVLVGKAPFKKVIGYGRILDEKGGMFSKSGPNNIKFDDAAETFGVDSMRWLFASGNPAYDVRFGANLIEETRKKMLAVYNAFAFYDTYAKIDKPSPQKHKPNNLDITDEWLVASINDLIKAAETAYEGHRVHEVVSLVENFVEDLSNFYIRINRRRFWKNQSDDDKQNAYFALYSAIRALAVIIAPIAPFLAEHIWQGIKTPNDAELVLGADYPSPIKLKLKYNDITKRAAYIRQIISLALSLRSRENLKLRQPLSTLYVISNEAESIKLFESVLKDEVNVKSIVTVADTSQFTSDFYIVDFKKAGQVLKDKVQALKTSLEKETAVIKNGKLSVGEFKNLPLDLFIKKQKSKPEFVSNTENDLTVVLDTTLNDGLVEEGNLRELVRNIQVARQDANLEITARVKIEIVCDAETQNLIEKHRQKICEETLAKEITTRKGETLEIKFKMA
jgi:isoleucyl-tRNA synthetase